MTNSHQNLPIVLNGWCPMIEKSSCETCAFYEVFDWRKSLINFSYWTNLSEMKANVWEEEMNLIGQFFLIG